MRLTHFDIGGGYCDQRSALAEGTTQAALLKDIHSACVAFQNSLGWPVKLMAEPGRMLIADAGVSVCRVTASCIQDLRFEDGAAIHQRHIVVYLDDGVYGNFMSQGPEQRLWNLRPLRVHSPEPMNGPELPAIVWGPTCDTYDQLAVAESFRLPNNCKPAITLCQTAWEPTRW